MVGRSSDASSRSSGSEISDDGSGKDTFDANAAGGRIAPPPPPPPVAILVKKKQMKQDGGNDGGDLAGEIKTTPTAETGSAVVGGSKSDSAAASTVSSTPRSPPSPLPSSKGDADDGNGDDGDNNSNPQSPSKLARFGGSLRLFGRMVGKVLNLPAVRGRVTMEPRVVIPMRDGVGITATVFTPHCHRSDVAGAGVVCNTDNAHPQSASASSTVLIRTPYGRKFMFLFAQRFCERGYHVVVTDTRGRCGAGGKYAPLEHDACDGSDTVAWIRAQPWSGTGPGHKVSMWGVSYLGLAQFAALAGAEADGGGPERRIDAICPVLANSQLHGVFRAGGGVSLGLIARWHYATCRIDEHTTDLGLVKLFGRDMDRDTAAAWDLPLSGLDAALAGDKAPTVFDSWLVDHTEDAEDSAFWAARDFSRSLPTAPPALLVAGVHDFFLPGMLRDYARLTECGRDVRLVIGPWAHFDPGALAAGLREGLWWLSDWAPPPPPPSLPSPDDGNGNNDGDKKGDNGGERNGGGESDMHRGATAGERRGQQRERPDPSVIDPRPVQVFVSGVGAGWKSMMEWPPAEANEAPLFLAKGRKLTRTVPAGPGLDAGQGEPVSKDNIDSYCYDPRHPTPSVGGPLFHPRLAGRRSQKARESRDDVLVFTSDPLAMDLEALGTARVELFVRSSIEHRDYSVVVCEVSRSAVGVSSSHNVCEGYVRVAGNRGTVSAGDGFARVVVEIAAIAHRFKKGRRIRLQVASGAHPRMQRNFGTGSPHLGDGADLVPSWQEVARDAARPSALYLPIVKGMLPT